MNRQVASEIPLDQNHPTAHFHYDGRTPGPQADVQHQQIYLPQYFHHPQQQTLLNNQHEHELPGDDTRAFLYRLLIVLGVIAAACTIAIGGMFASWIGGSILSAAGWNAGFNAHQIMHLSFNIFGNWALFYFGWEMYTKYRRPKEDHDRFLGYRGISAALIKNALFWTAGALIQPFFMGIMTGAPYGFALAATAIGLPLAIAGAVVATYFIIVNLAGLFAPAWAASLYTDGRTLASTDSATDIPPNNRADLISDAMANARTMFENTQSHGAPSTLPLPDTYDPGNYPRATAIAPTPASSESASVNTQLIQYGNANTNALSTAIPVLSADELRQRRLQHFAQKKIN